MGVPALAFCWVVRLPGARLLPILLPSAGRAAITSTIGMAAANSLALTLPPDLLASVACFLPDLSLPLFARVSTCCLAAAAAETAVRVSKSLLQLGQVTKATTDRGYMLCYAARNGMALLVRSLLIDGADVNAAHGHGYGVFEFGRRRNFLPEDAWTALMHAAHNGHLAVVRILLHAGADASREDSSYERHKERITEWVPSTPPAPFIYDPARPNATSAPARLQFELDQRRLELHQRLRSPGRVWRQRACGDNAFDLAWRRHHVVVAEELRSHAASKRHAFHAQSLEDRIAAADVIALSTDACNAIARSTHPTALEAVASAKAQEELQNAQEELQRAHAQKAHLARICQAQKCQAREREQAARRYAARRARGVP